MLGLGCRQLSIARITSKPPLTLKISPVNIDGLAVAHLESNFVKEKGARIIHLMYNANIFFKLVHLHLTFPAFSFYYDACNNTALLQLIEMFEIQIFLAIFAF